MHISHVIHSPVGNDNKSVESRTKSKESYLIIYIYSSQRSPNTIHV